MAVYEMVMPQMGESVMEGTIIKWLKNIGDFVKQDESVLEVATDKVDTEIPSTFTGYIKELLVKEGDVVQIGNPIAIIASSADAETPTEKPVVEKLIVTPVPTISIEPLPQPVEVPHIPALQNTNTPVSEYGRFYSPLVLSIAKEEKISLKELETIPGTGQEGRVTKNDILHYVQNRPKASETVVMAVHSETVPLPSSERVLPVSDKVEKNEIKSSTVSLPDAEPEKPLVQLKPASSVSGGTEIIQMDRMRKIIAERMLDSKRISAHVTSFVEADVTNLIHWKNKMKHEFKNRENDTLTLTPLFIEAIARAIKDFPLINSSIEGDNLVVKKYINIGMAVALPSGNLIVPVIKNVDQLNIIGITKKVNELARKARENKLTADDLSDGTYTMSNVGQFGNVMGTPIIVQPQLAIMAFGTALKKPAVIETPNGDAIGIRSMMYLSHSYDHRVVDGALGGMFVRKVADYLENFDVNRKIW
ncbi:MAG: dihydrolipoamide acetyltransferase family protein [Cytophagales bacterium]